MQNRIRGRRTVTLHDVAAEADVSLMTVSNVINGKFGAMKDTTRLRVERAVERLNYRPHASARSLRLSRRLSIGLIIIDDSPNYLADPFITYVLAGLSNHLSECGFGLLVQGLAERQFENSSLIRHLRTDGMCVMLSGKASVRHSFLQVLLGLDQPIILLQENVDVAHGDVCVLRQDDRGGGRLLAAHVLERGAKCLVMLLPDRDWPALEERKAGICEVVAESGGDPTLLVISCGKGDYSDTHKALAAHIDAQGLPDAFLAGNDQMGIVATKLLASLEVSVPEQVLITGFNAFEFWQYTDPPLTTVRSRAYEIGTRSGGGTLKATEGRDFFRERDPFAYRAPGRRLDLKRMHSRAHRAIIIRNVWAIHLTVIFA